ncbi:MAG: hypothetical protein JO142_10205 [Burkholderiales bacterium]|nr:hypothetical protein [Burkholderiales bacterium]
MHTMARLHFAYCFDSARFGEQPALLANQQAEVWLSYLQAQAILSVRNPTAAMQEALVAVRFGRDWLAGDPFEADRAAKCLLLCLLRQCAAVPSLGRVGEPPHHVVLKLLLADAGWSPSMIATLLCGDDLNSYLRETALDRMSPMMGGLSDFGGWISYTRAQALRSALDEVKDYFNAIGRRQKALLGHIVPEWGTRASLMAWQAYARAQSMLEEVTSPEKALFLILD